MNLDITNKNLYLLLPGKVSRVAQIYAHEHHVTIIEAMRRFYHSDTYKRLADETTKLWHYGPVALYQEFVDELNQKGNKGVRCEPAPSCLFPRATSQVAMLAWIFGDCREGQIPRCSVALQV